jgi:hypothetical protein
VQLYPAQASFQPATVKPATDYQIVRPVLQVAPAERTVSPAQNPLQPVPIGGSSPSASPGSGAEPAAPGSSPSTPGLASNPTTPVNGGDSVTAEGTSHSGSTATPSIPGSNSDGPASTEYVSGASGCSMLSETGSVNPFGGLSILFLVLVLGLARLGFTSSVSQKSNE